MSNVLSMEEAIKMLLLFADTNPCPKDESFKFNDSLTELLNELRQAITLPALRVGLVRAENTRTEDISCSMWYQKATAKSANFIPPPSWDSIDDTLSLLGMLAFGIPEIGIPLSGFFGAIEKLHKNKESQDKYMEKIRGNWKSSELKLAEEELKSLIGQQEWQAMIHKIISEATFLKKYMSNMLIHPDEIESSRQTGFNEKWVSQTIRKEDILGKDGLGRVWMLVESEEFQEFLDSPLLNSTAQLNLVEEPTVGTVTISAYSATISTVVLAIKLYAIVRLLPEEALHPNWDPKKDSPFSSSEKALETLKADFEAKSGDGESERTARSCYEFLLERLDPHSSISWFARLDPSKGDAATAYQKILNRLNLITYNKSGVPGLRDGHWFLQKDSETEADPTVQKPYDVYKNQCAPSQYELKDKVRNANPRDSFVEPYLGFFTELKINWAPGSLTADFILEPLECIYYNHEYGVVKGPLPEPDSSGNISSYDQISWHDSLAKIQFDTIAWIGFILVNYSSSLRFKIDIEAKMTTCTVIHDVYDALRSVYLFVYSVSKVYEKIEHSGVASQEAKNIYELVFAEDDSVSS